MTWLTSILSALFGSLWDRWFPKKPDAEKNDEKVLQEVRQAHDQEIIDSKLDDDALRLQTKQWRRD